MTMDGWNSDSYLRMFNDAKSLEASKMFLLVGSKSLFVLPASLWQGEKMEKKKPYPIL